jgi:predicted acetyltransferase
MSNVVVRPYDDARDREAYWHVRAMTYNDGNPYPEERRVHQLTHGYVAEVDGVLEANFSVVDFRAIVRGAELKTAGIAAVAVLPHRRGTGIGTEMMRKMVQVLHAEGYELASLYAFREPFYRKVGFEACGKRIRVHCPVDRLPKLEPELPIRHLTFADYEQLEACHRAFVHARSGMNLRDDKHWKRVLAENRELAIYAAGDPVEAYAVISHSTAFWSTDHVSEFVWSSPSGYRSILAFFRGLGINKTALSWYEPSDSPFLANYLDQGIELKIERTIMYRTLNADAVLQKVAPNLEVYVADELLGDRAGPGTDLQVEQRRFTQALLGEPSLADQLRNGLISRASQAAMECFPPRPTYCLEFF